MTLSEFRAWFEGFSEGIDKAPTEKQFAKIKAKVAEITTTPTTSTVFIDRWVQPYRQYWDTYYVSSTTGMDSRATMSATLQAVGRSDGIGVANFETVHPDQDVKYFDSDAAFRELGRMESSH